MRFREFVREAAVPGSPTQDPTKTVTTVDPNAEGSQKVQQLTAAMSGLQKQIQTLQKAALQTPAPAVPNAPAAAAPAPGQGSQQQVPKGTVGTGTSNGTLAQQQQQPPTPGQPVAGQKPGLGQPNGVPMGQAPAQTSTTPPMGVSQPPQIVKSKIQQDLQKQISK